MTKVRVVPQEHYMIIREYINGPGVVLISEEKAKEISKSKNVEISDHMSIDYDFAGEADCWVDVVTTESHIAVEAFEDAVIEDEE